MSGCAEVVYVLLLPLSTYTLGVELAKSVHLSSFLLHQDDGVNMAIECQLVAYGRLFGEADAGGSFGQNFLDGGVPFAEVFPGRFSLGHSSAVI